MSSRLVFRLGQLSVKNYLLSSARATNKVNDQFSQRKREILENDDVMKFLLKDVLSAGSASGPRLISTLR